MELNIRLLEGLRQSDTYRLPREILERQQDLFGRELILISDMEGTLFNLTQDKQFAQPALPELKNMLEDESILVGYNTGLGLNEALTYIQERNLFIPHILINQVAGQINVLKVEAYGKSAADITVNDYTIDAVYERSVLDSGFDKTAVTASAKILIEDLQNEGFGNFNLTVRERKRRVLEDQTIQRVDLEYNLPDGTSDDEYEAFLEQIRQAFPNLNIVDYFEWKKVAERGRNLTLSPRGKDSAIEQLIEVLDLSEGIIAGDAANDWDALFSTNLPTSFTRVMVGTDNPDRRMMQYFDSLEPLDAGDGFFEVNSARGTILYYRESGQRRDQASLYHALTELLAS